MKWIPLFLMSMTLLVSCNSGNNQEGDTEAADIPMDQVGKQPVGQTIIPGADSSGAVMEVAEDAYDFGTVNEGEKVNHEFKFTNTGSAPLIISNVQASCGCTTPEYSKNPIAPGDEGLVKVVFNSAGQLGKQHKVITITSNAASEHTLLHLRGEVVK
ncbi:DUF1573 domain-containing protein [Parapedobacter sp. 10938]|uniref:DUF1573 domain-containing protein n=1 Tax=Parapedobacter flavus TaxID=3110225 RepID=UPI002DBF7DF7|nr:DUF1573 domain-containing protein [Parapedobacter sp. 10938]MEC3878799.1 DUF1573 domain-containing protein [Parapedobacter sp. 10938]